MGSGADAPNPASEVVDFHTVFLSLRYGLTRRINVSATMPYHSIQSDKIQGAPYSRLNRGFGDLLVTAAYRLGTSPQFTLEAGVKFATGNVDKKDDLGQRICDILALGSGTNDLVIGAGFWMPHVVVHGLDVTAGLRHRFTSGENKWGYRFGDQTLYDLHGSHLVGERTRLGLRFDGYHSGRDTWYGNVVPERGATFVYVGPTVSYKMSDTMTVGGFARFPLVMRLEGSQMVAPLAFGLEFTTDVSRFVKALVPNEGDE
ncbi:MAG: hypothetical protein ACE5EO_08350 [Candidatus Krumholzibacteriia bacterium]